MIQGGTYADLQTSSRPLTKKSQGSGSRYVRRKSPLLGLTAWPTKAWQGRGPSIDVLDIAGVAPLQATSPEQHLWQAVLAEALRCVLMGAYVRDRVSQDRPAGRMRLRDEAIAWVNSDEEGFPSVCEFAGVEPSYIRKLFQGFLQPSTRQNRTARNILTRVRRRSWG